MVEKWAKDGSESSCGMPSYSDWETGIIHPEIDFNFHFCSAMGTKKTDIIGYCPTKYKYICIYFVNDHLSYKLKLIGKCII